MHQAKHTSNNLLTLVKKYYILQDGFAKVVFIIYQLSVDMNIPSGIY